MPINIINSTQSTYIFIIIFIIANLFFLRKTNNKTFFSQPLSLELKGLAILMVFFAHIGYLLSSDHNFLFPLSIMAGVGVDIFLFLSGYGLANSSLTKKISTKDYYKKRLLKLYLPFWLSCIVLLLLDYFIIHKTYNLSYIFQSLIGFFPSADAFNDLNSPLWYFSLTIFYSILFPLFFWRRFPLLSSLVFYLLGYSLIKMEPDLLKNVIHLYKVHILAFPLGVFFASLVFKSQNSTKLKSIINKIFITIKSPITKNILKYCLLFVLLIFICYNAYNSNINGSRLAQEITSNITMLAIIIVFLIKKIDNKLLYWLGVYSYEIYLLHWPIMYRFDIFYRYLPGWLATIAYLIFFILLGYIFKIINAKIFSLIKKN